MTRQEAHERYEMLEAAIEYLQGGNPTVQFPADSTFGRAVTRLRGLQAACWEVMTS